MNERLVLVISSLLSILLLTFHATQDTLHARVGTPEAGGSTLVGVPVLVVWLYGTVQLAERRSGHIIMLVGALIALGMPVIHVMGPRGIFKGEMARYGDAYFFFWTLFMLGLMGMLSLILSMRGLWRLRRSARAISQ